MNKKHIFGIIYFMVLCAILLVVSLSAIMVSAHPSLPTEFYGTVRSYNAPGTGVVKVYAGAINCGTFTIINSGYYGVLSCMGQDTDSSNITGGIDGQTITFRYNNNPVTIRGDTNFTSGAFKLVNITFPIVFCGDSFCDALESCGDCPQDCQACNATGNVSQNVTGNVTSNETTPPGPGTGGGGGGAGGGGKGGLGGAGAVGGATGEFSCTESWTCINWSDCSILGIRNRTCSDSNNCATYNTKPKEIEECKYVGTCFDNLINCHDGKCEEGIDCNGPCEKKCPTIEQPLFNVSIKVPTFEIPRHVCERHINFNNSALLLFLIIIFTSLIGRLIYTKIYIYSSRKSEKMTPLERAKKITSAKRKTIIFVITVISLTIVSLLYCYYFLLCPSDFFEYSWLLIVVIILIPFVIHAIMKKFEYNESKHVYKSKRLDDVHYQSLVKMIELENNMLSDEENAIANKLYELSKKDEFKDLLEADQNLKDIYQNLVKLYSDYKDKKNPFNIERNVCDEIDALDSDVLFKSSISKHPEMAHLFDRLKKIYSQYEEKQKLYDKLDELEQSGQKEDSEKKQKK
jgi:hypothetical protein